MPTNAELARDVKALSQEIEEMKKSLSVFNTLYENMKEKQEQLTSENKVLKKENEQLSKGLAESEQYSRLNNIEIKGIPCTQGEDCSKILEKSGKQLVCTVTSADV
ncbi:hypothetical protein HPB48_010062 [Haemaphysalis longicornis]|uniref:Uncharacterized protein n=1 Tax=Haemaphysalis longicornis TaxID=44386 RepID=A0A9J6GLY5_HAELO|nr:hypothetical protein HPB48_010062 [Haemaphysalis longicornis]